MSPIVNKAPQVKNIKKSTQANSQVKNKQQLETSSPASSAHGQNNSESIDPPAPIGIDMAHELPAKLPALRFYNAYRTRIFWHEELLKNSKKIFTVAFRVDVPKDNIILFKQGLRPSIEWESFVRPSSRSPRRSVAKGQFFGSAKLGSQVVPLPNEAWRVASSDVEVDLVLKWHDAAAAADGTRDAKRPVKERATIRIRSIKGLMNQNPELALLIKLIDAPKSPALVNTAAPAKNGQVFAGSWLTSWGKLATASSTMSIMLAPGYSAQLVKQLLAQTHDFDLSFVPWSYDHASWSEVWINQGQSVVAIKKTGMIESATSLALGKSLGGFYPGSLRFRGSTLAYACDLKQISPSLGQCLEKLTVSVLHLYAPNRNPPFIQIKRDVLVKNLFLRDTLSQEGQYLFTDPVEFL